MVGSAWVSDRFVTMGDRKKEKDNKRSLFTSAKSTKDIRLEIFEAFLDGMDGEIEPGSFLHHYKFLCKELYSYMLGAGEKRFNSVTVERWMVDSHLRKVYNLVKVSDSE